jgi:hypothetical protein
MQRKTPNKFLMRQRSLFAPAIGNLVIKVTLSLSMLLILWLLMAIYGCNVPNTPPPTLYFPKVLSKTIHLSTNKYEENFWPVFAY